MATHSSTFAWRKSHGQRGASEAIDHGVAKSQTRLSNFPRFPINKILVQLREFSLKQVGKKKKKKARYSLAAQCFGLGALTAEGLSSFLVREPRWYKPHGEARKTNQNRHYVEKRNVHILSGLGKSVC